MGEWIWYACCQCIIPACLEMAVDLRDGCFGECSESSHVAVWQMHCVMIWHQCGYAHDVALVEQAVVECDSCSHLMLWYFNSSKPPHLIVFVHVLCKNPSHFRTPWNFSNAPSVIRFTKFNLCLAPLCHRRNCFKEAQIMGTARWCAIFVLRWLNCHKPLAH